MIDFLFNHVKFAGPGLTVLPAPADNSVPAMAGRNGIAQDIEPRL